MFQPNLSPKPSARPLPTLWRCTVAAAALLACQAASAEVITTTFSGSGNVHSLGEPTPAGELPLIALGSYDFAGFGTWELASAFLFNPATGTGSGIFQFSQGSTTFSGAVATTAAPVAFGSGFEIVYLADTGTGPLAGAFGGGNSFLRVTGDLAGPPPYAYIEAGIFSLSVPVPEPASGLLMLGGAAALLGRRWLRR